ncbi:MAG: SemiSWEET family transporter [Candidatus Paceibacterota bacterium]
MNEKNVDKIGWIASFLAILMYFSYIDQIRLNISGQTGSVILPVITTVNCTFWVLYGSLKSKKDWPLIVCNIPGVVLGIITAITAIIF